MRSIPEDPAAFYTPDVLEGLDPGLWDEADLPWEQASLALGATIRGRLFGAVLALVPDRHRWHAMVLLPPGAGIMAPDVWRDPARCLLAARARLAADVVDEGRLWRAAEKFALDEAGMRDLVRQTYGEARPPTIADSRDEGDAPGGRAGESEVAPSEADGADT